MEKNVNYSISSNGETVIKNFNIAKPFSSFFPGVTGTLGIPMWVFYVNRGQCISSFGIENKDKPILEFFPANRAYHMTSLVGFRTFLKINKSQKNFFYEPFNASTENSKYNCTNEMVFTQSYLKITEINSELGIKVTVTYITVPEQCFPALARKVTIENISNENISVDIIDGLPWVNSYGLETWVQKHMSRTAEAWVEVTNTENKIPIYKLKVVIADRPEVEYFHCGNFSAYLEESKLLPAIIDPHVIFGNNTDLNCPSHFLEKDFSIPAFQTFENYTPCAMTYAKYDIQAKTSKTIHGIFGHASDITKVNDLIKSFVKPDWFENSMKRNEEIIDSLQNSVRTFSSSDTYDNYCKNTFLDNILRGGFPITFESEGKKQIFHIYSRKHGDLERDYNHFSLQASYYTQGNGNFRDINQNRRNDAWFNTDVFDSNIKTFFNLIQLDGHNPLVLKGVSFLNENLETIKPLLNKINNTEKINAILAIIKKPYTPGFLIQELEHKFGVNNIGIDRNELLKTVIPNAKKIETSDHGEGYWSDHWTYNIDLIESFLKLYPEKLDYLLLENKDYTYYQNYAWINPRNKRYILRNGKPFQTNNVSEDHAKMKSRDIYQSEVKTKYGKGENYHTNLYSKLLCLITNKLATLDPFGVGIELEGGKTNWNDSVNGLPGLFGSSTCETLELKRLIQFLLNTNKTSSFEDILIPKEIMKFVKDLFKLLNRLSSDFNSSAFEYWNESANIKETFRAKVKFGIDGEEKPLTKTFINRFLKLALKKIECGLENAFDKNTGVLNSYFINEVETFDTVKNDTSEYIIPKKFRQIPTALFLEGPMHFIRTSKDLAREQYTAVKNSPLYDTKLKMYKVCESMSKMPKELGRCTVFSPGWLENESIFLHMEYKFLLETLKNKMYSEFFEDLKNAFVPYQDPEVYGRSILENSSFIVSSANTNENLHGTGFVARLSGSTAEFIHMWLYMNLGFEPFFLNNEGKLNFMLSPILPADFFSESTREVSWTYNDKSEKISLPKNHYAFVFLSNTLVIYENINLKNTYGKNACKVKSYKLIDKNGKEETFETEVLDEKSSLQIRKGIYKVIHVKLI